MSQEIEEELRRMVQHHVDHFGGVNPPDAGQAAEGTWEDVGVEGEPVISTPNSPTKMPPMDITANASQRMPAMDINGRQTAAPTRMKAMDISGALTAPSQTMPEMDISPRVPKAPPIAAGGSPPRPPVDLSKPLGYSPPKDTQLAELQAAAKQRRSQAALGQTVADFTERPTNFLDYAQRLGGGGVSAPPPKTQMWKNHAAEGEQDLADFKERRASDASMAATAEDSDPNSPTAQAYRSVLVKFAPDIAEKLQGANAKQMRQMAPWLEKFHSENNDLLQANAAAEAKAVQQAKTDKEKGAALSLAQTHYEQGQRNHEQNHQDSLGMQRAILGDRQKTNKDNADLKATDKLDDETAALAKASGADVAMGRKALDEVDAAIAKSGGEAPGTGRLTAMLPDAVLSDEGNKVRQNALDALAIMLSVRSGATVSPEELKRSQGIYGINGSSEQFNEGMQRLRRDFESSLAAKQAGFGPEVKKKFAGQGGTLAHEGSVQVVDNKGHKYNVPAAEAAALKAELKAAGLL